MIMLTPSNDNVRDSILIIGKGLIGSAIVKELLNRACVIVKQHEIDDWLNIKEVNSKLTSILNFCSQIGVKSVDLIWAAGKAGFEATTNQINLEYLTFKNIISILNTHFSQPGVKARFHLISSAGGLFEGQKHIDHYTLPNPQRPYGFLKTKQEALVKNQVCFMPYIVYRPTTVYGYIRTGMRTGLISNLIKNSIRRRTTIIYGDYNTMRDYLWVEDLSLFIVDMVFSKNQINKTFTLASCRPFNIFQIHKIIENRIRQNCMIRFFSTPSNTEHNTYSLAVVPRGLKTTSITTNIIKIYNDALHQVF